MKLVAHQKAVLYLILANFIWGAASPIFKWSLTDIQPFTLAFFRFFIGAIILFPFTFKKLKIQKDDLLNLFALSFFGITINISFFFLGLELTSAINAPIIATAGPIFLLCACFFYLKEKIKFRAVIGTLVGTIGVLMVILRPLFENGFDLALAGNLFLVIATIAGVIHTILVRKIANKYEPLTITFWAFLIGAITFVPFFVTETLRVGLSSQLTFTGISGIAFGSIFSSAIAYCAFYWAVKNMQTQEVGIFAYLDPFVALIIAYPLLGERPTPIYVVGMILVFIGILIAEKRIPYHPLHLFKQINGLIS